MKPLYLLISCLFLFTSWQLSAQDHQQEIKDQFQMYRKLTLNKNFDGLMDYIYPKLFEIVSREKMVEIFEQLDGEDMRFDFVALELVAVSDRLVQEKEQFALVQYDMAMRLEILNPEMRTEPMLDMMLTTFRASYGEDNVVLDIENASYDIQSAKSMLAIAPLESSDWKFIENNPDQAELTKMLVGEPVFNHFNPKD